MKKDFQKVIKAIRDEDNAKHGREGRDKIEYPKPMMTAAQMEKSTATVNLGGEWSNYERTSGRAEMVMNDERFKSFLQKWNATATKELMTRFNTFQIRIDY